MVQEFRRVAGTLPVGGRETVLLGKAVLASLPDDEPADRLGRVHELPVFTAKSHRTLAALRCAATSPRRGNAVMPLTTSRTSKASRV